MTKAINSMIRLNGAFAVALTLASLPAVAKRQPASYDGPSPLEAQPTTFLSSASPKDQRKSWYQNWSAVERKDFYFRPQGSWMIPLDYAEALTDESGKKFFTSENLRKYGFIPQKDDKAAGSKAVNPLGLPIGFAIDGGQTFSFNPFNGGSIDSGRRYVGITCAACHTQNLRIKRDGKDTVVRVDGGQGYIDFQQFVFDMDKAVLDKASNPDAFISSLRAEPSLSAEQRKADFLRFAAERTEWERLNGWGVLGGKTNKGFVWGAGRNDAFGVILNQVLVTAFEKPENFYGRKANGEPLLDENGQRIEYRPEAPVSYPVVWDAHQHSHVQWNGLASNGPPGPIARNVGEVLGVFGKIDIFKKTALTNGFCTSARREDLLALEEGVKTLWSPKWDPNVFGALDQKLVAEGSKVYASRCIKCHELRNRTGDPDSSETYTVGIGEKLIDMDKVKTDPKMNLAVVSRLSKVPTQIIGRKFKLKEGYELSKVEPAGLVLKHVVASALAGAISILSCENTDMSHLQAAKKWYEIIKAIRNEGKTPAQIPRTEMKPDEAEQALDEIEKAAAEAQAAKTRPMALEEKQAELTKELGKYKARPLNGIWTSAPFLHNGSVASLWDLLQPVNRRHLGLPITEDPTDAKHAGKQARTTLKVGCNSFDPVKVGLDCEGNWGDPETRYIEKDIDLKQYGNRPVGHEFGTDLKYDEKLQLLEYLKSL